MIPRKFSYEPCLTNVTNHWHSRWNAIRKLVNSWYGLELSNANYQESMFKYPQFHNLSPSFCEWILFQEEIAEICDIQFIIRDDFKIDLISSPKSISLQVISEGNVCSAVLWEDLKMDDPPVQALMGECHGDYDENEKFSERWKFGFTEYSSITEFALEQVTHMMQGEAGGCYVGIDESEQNLFITEMTDYFERTTQFGAITIFESPNMFATFHDRHLYFELQTEIELETLPNCILRNIQNGGGFHGILITH